jgi:hypothetical protein
MVKHGKAWQTVAKHGKAWQSMAMASTTLNEIMLKVGMSIQDKHSSLFSQIIIIFQKRSIIFASGRAT